MYLKHINEERVIWLCFCERCSFEGRVSLESDVATGLGIIMFRMHDSLVTSIWVSRESFLLFLREMLSGL